LNRGVVTVRFARTVALIALSCLVSTASHSRSIAADTKPATKKTQTRPSKSNPQTSPATQTAPAAENSPIQSKEGVTIRENYFMELPGIDLSTLTPKQKQRYLDRVNQEICTCGCPHDTIARCLVNDPKCPTVRGLAEKVLSEVKSGK
jgi:hypothetical protein